MLSLRVELIHRLNKPQDSSSWQTQASTNFSAWGNLYIPIWRGCSAKLRPQTFPQFSKTQCLTSGWTAWQMWPNFGYSYYNLGIYRLTLSKPPKNLILKLQRNVYSLLRENTILPFSPNLLISVLQVCHNLTTFSSSSLLREKSNVTSGFSMSENSHFSTLTFLWIIFKRLSDKALTP